MGKYFGTDGMRGEAGVFLCAHHAFKIGRFLGGEAPDGRVVIGKDTRHSSGMLESALVAGILSSGASAYLLDVCPTACVSYITNKEGFDFGIMISASHNPYFDNGIKILNSSGEKISDELTERIEEFLDANDDGKNAKGEKIGKAHPYPQGVNTYKEYLKQTSQAPLFGLRIGLDLSNGSATDVAPEVFSSLGATVYKMSHEPNGININEGCGSTSPAALCAFVKENSLDCGFAYDGDSDRCIAVTEEGEVFDGDKIMYALAKSLKEKGELEENVLVTTVMSNVGLKKSLSPLGIRVKETKVGDRFVFEEMKSSGYSLGGEQSGHVIISKYASTGDGILTSIKLAELLAICAMPFSSLDAGLTLYPQVQKNIKVINKEGIMISDKLNAAIKDAESTLDGRILVRASGTEPKIRVLVEGRDKGECKRIAKRLESIILSEDKA